jgi:phosphotransferase family enzyme
MMTSSRIGEHPSALFTTGLPILQIALNLRTMTRNLGSLIESSNGFGGRPEVAHANLVAYKQGNRGLIRYDLAGVPDGEDVVLGKLYPDPGRAERVEGIMRRLWDIFRDREGLSVPEPLGCIPELAMLLFRPLPGRLLDAAIAGDGDESTIELCARWIATLHHSPMALDRRFDLAVESVNLEAWTALIAHRRPQFASETQALFKSLRARADDLSLDTDAPVHKDFHYQHVFVNGAVGVIDFDEMRWGDRNFDIAHFCAHLSLLSWRTPGKAASDVLVEKFLSSYSQWSDWRRDDRFDFFYAYTCLKIAKQLATTRGPRPRPEGAELERQLGLVLQSGRTAIAKEE